MKFDSYKFSVIYNLAKNIRVYIFSCAVAFILSSCASRSSQFEVGVDSIVDPSMIEKENYFLYPADSTISIEDLHFKEYSNYIRTALKAL